MPDRIVGDRIIHDRRQPLRMEPLQTLAEPVLEELYPGISRTADADIDQLLRLFYEGAWREHSDEIVAEIQAFADFHPVDDQRTDEAIKAWAHQCGAELAGDYSQSYYRVAVHVGLAAYVQHMRALRAKMTCDVGWHQLVERFHFACSSQFGYGFLNAGEKWGGLSLSYKCDPAGEVTCRTAEKVAVDASLNTCEKCGQPGCLQTGGWKKTLCDQHVAGRYDD